MRLNTEARLILVFATLTAVCVVLPACFGALCVLIAGKAIAGAVCYVTALVAIPLLSREYCQATARLASRHDG